MRNAYSEGETIKIDQEAAFSDSFEIRYVVNKFIDISSLNKEEERAKSEKGLRHSNKYE